MKTDNLFRAFSLSYHTHTHPYPVSVRKEEAEEVNVCTKLLFFIISGLSLLYQHHKLFHFIFFILERSKRCFIGIIVI